MLGLLRHTNQNNDDNSLTDTKQTQTISSPHFTPKFRLMSDSTTTRSRPGLATRAKNTNQRPGKVLTNGRRTCRSSAQMHTDNLKKAEKAAAVISGKKIELGTNNAAVRRRIARHHASTARRPTTAIEQSRSDDVGSANQGPLTVQPVQVLEHTKALYP